MFIIYEKSTGIVDKAIHGHPDAVALNVGDGQAFIEVESEVVAQLPEYSYVEGGRWITAPAQPSPYHAWDWPTKSWIADLSAAASARARDVAIELDRRNSAPCAGFDADKLSRDRISSMIARLQRGDGLPAGWIGWRDASNDMHWVADDAATVLANLTALSRAIENREQALLIAAWQHKAAIAALTSVEALLAYDVTAGW
jgi:hypothetical protein